MLSASPTVPRPLTPALAVSVPVHHDALVSSRPVERLLELRLMHQYTNATSKTLLTNSLGTEDIWESAVPHMAFSGQGKVYLADAMLSIAALHLRSLTPHDKAVIEASHAYSASALAAYCAALESGITADNAEALFLTASLIAFQATASRIFAKDDADADADAEPENDEPSSRYVLPVAWFHAFQGVKTVVATSWQWLRNSSAVKAVIDSQPSFQLDMNPLGPNSYFGHLLEGLDDELAAEPGGPNPASSHAYAHAVSVLNWAHRNPHAPACLSFPASVSRRFVELVEAKRPRALAILACFFALLKRIENVWWLQGVSRREVMGLVSMLESGSSWWRHLEWPIRIALWDGGPVPADVWGSKCDEEMPGGSGLVESMMSHIELLAKMMNRTEYAPAGSAAVAELVPAPLD